MSAHFGFGLRKSPNKKAEPKAKSAKAKAKAKVKPKPSAAVGRARKGLGPPWRLGPGGDPNEHPPLPAAATGTGSAGPPCSIDNLSFEFESSRL